MLVSVVVVKSPKFQFHDVMLPVVAAEVSIKETDCELQDFAKSKPGTGVGLVAAISVSVTTLHPNVDDKTSCTEPAPSSARDGI